MRLRLRRSASAAAATQGVNGAAFIEIRRRQAFCRAAAQGIPGAAFEQEDEKREDVAQ